MTPQWIGLSAILDETVETWLQGYAGYQEYLRASEVLSKAFARSLHGSRCSLPEAFAAFRQFLINEREYKHFEVTEVFPNRNSHTE